MAGAGALQAERRLTRRTVTQLPGPLGPNCDANPRLGSVAGHSRIVEHGLGPTILGPAGGLVTDSDRALLAIGDRLDARGVDPVACQEGLDRHGPPGTEREVVLPRAALIGVALDGHSILRVLVKPARLMAEDAAGFSAERRAVLLEMHKVADANRELLGRPWRCHRPGGADSVFLGLSMACAGSHQQSNCDDARNCAGVADPTIPTHYWLLPLAKILGNRRAQFLNDPLVSDSREG